MKLKIKLIFILVIICSQNSYSQKTEEIIIADTLSNCEGKKEGCCITFFNENLRITKRRKEAAYFGYSYYLNNQIMYPHYGVSVVESKLLTNSLKGVIGGPILLNGVYYKVHKGDTIASYNYENGYLQLAITYSDNGNISNYLDFQKKYKDDELSYYVIIYDVNEKITSSGYFTQIKGWLHFIDDEKL